MASEHVEMCGKDGKNKLSFTSNVIGENNLLNILSVFSSRGNERVCFVWFTICTRKETQRMARRTDRADKVQSGPETIYCVVLM